MPMSPQVMSLLRKLSINTWLRAHGKFVRPELTKKQKQELKECFDLIDLDGSGAIDSDELLTAFNVLGMHVKRSEVDRMLDEVDEDKSGEVEYPEFVQIMTTKLDSQSKEDLEEEAKPKVQPLPFQLLAQAYRRKKMMEAVMGGDKAAQQRLRAKADEAESERLAVLAAMEAEKQNPALAYKEPGRVDLQQQSPDLRKFTSFNLFQKAQLRKMDAGFPVYIADNIDQDVRDALLGVHEVPKFTIKREKPPLVKSSHLPCGRELRPFTLSQHIREVYQAELIDVKKRRAAVRHRPVLEQQMIHLKALKSIQEIAERNNRRLFRSASRCGFETAAGSNKFNKAKYFRSASSMETRLY
ncbi:hypothetical protein SELMODRAFT_407440 [Selaginella moellendorffii]|uniref:EF-hand domain-containing protein n=1 Tax=Selaginella moellendorffii TaxID=88036 RepID=D8R5L9_SELML|nr:hypothetical protein SELMODRAFT_407440 [Selaginella moellendorffii]